MNILTKGLNKLKAIGKGITNIDNQKSYKNYGASRVKKTVIGWMTNSLSPSRDIDDNQKLLRERARDLTQGGSSIGRGALKKLKTNVVGVGLKMKSTIDSQYLNLDTEEKKKIECDIQRVWELWADSKNCDMARQDNFYQLTALIFYSYLQNGDAFALLPYKQRNGDYFGLKIQLIESDRCFTPFNHQTNDGLIRNGVETNRHGEILAYYFSNNHPGDNQFIKKDEMVRVQAYGKSGHQNVLVLMDRERIGQKRGVPFLAPVIEDIKQIARYTEAEMMAAVINALFTLFIENEKEENQSGFGGLDNQEQDDGYYGEDNPIMLGSGNVIELAPGQKANSSTPGRPNKNFDSFVSGMVKQLGSALEIPYEVLLNQFNSSYSASRAALLEVWKVYRQKRANLVYDFCQPVFEKFMDEVVARGYIEAPGYFEDPLKRKAYLKNEWHGPSQGQIDPLKEAKAAKIRIEENLSTRSREARELNGSDFDANIKQNKLEEEERSELVNVKEVTEDVPVKKD